MSPSTGWAQTQISGALFADPPAPAGETEPIAGLVPVLPRLPQQPPRAAEGDALQDRWLRTRPDDDKETVASVAKPMQGNDASIEVIVGQGRLLTLKAPIVGGRRDAMIAVGDPSIVDFEVLPNPQMIRIIGRQAGVTDLSITTSDGKTYGFEVHVVYDLALLRAQLQQLFPDSLIKLSQIREHLVVEGQARSAQQVQQIVSVLRAYLQSVRPRQMQNAQGGQQQQRSDVRGGSYPQGQPGGQAGGDEEEEAGEEDDSMYGSTQYGYINRPMGGTGTVMQANIVNLMTVPGSQQVLLNVRIAELNRTALRQIGADMLAQWGPGNVINTRMTGSGTAAQSASTLLGLTPATSSTAFAIFPTGSFEIALTALRQNSVISILAEPNLIAFSGQQASFLAGGEFPVPVPQAAGAGATAIGLQFKEFGVKLNFTPFVLSEDTIRLRVAPEASTIDNNIGTTILGTTVPGVNTRRVDTTVELGQGQTLVLAGLLSVALDAQTTRIPGLGDLPYLGPLFSNTTHRRVEKELLVLVTPYLVRPMEADQVPSLPGSEIQDPNDLEFYFLNRIEGRTGNNFRSTTAWDDPWGFRRLLHFESQQVAGPVGFSELETMSSEPAPAPAARTSFLPERSSRR
ncbi:MAG: pilus assembly protein N-terminal domain-containing protein [Pirellulales bacterium]